MAGLSVLLEPQNPFPKCPQIINKTNISTKQSPPSLSSHYAPFLRHCFLCHQSLKEGKDIYMYRGDKAFCSEECRCRQIFMDEESGRRDGCSLAVARRSRKSRPVGGGFA